MCTINTNLNHHALNETGQVLAQLNHVSVTYSPGTPQQYQALQDVSLQIQRGDFVGVIGRSGSGKSTLMKVLGCEERPTEGEYVFDGASLQNADPKTLGQLRSRRISVIPQHYNLSMQKSVLENVALPLDPHRFSHSERRRRAMRALRDVALTEQANRMPDQLSGGQQQRVAIARAIVQRPAMILADEPTGALDMETKEYVFRIFEKINESGIAVLLITHDLSVAARTRRLIRIDDGQICEDRRLENTA